MVCSSAAFDVLVSHGYERSLILLKIHRLEEQRHIQLANGGTSAHSSEIKDLWNEYRASLVENLGVFDEEID
jgi:hypothetical protein